MRIHLTEEDLEALARLAVSEVGHFGRHGASQLRGAVAAVVDTVINRVASRSHVDRTVQGAIDRPFQFSGVHAAGGWRNLPPANVSIREIVEAHLERRAGGGASEIRGAGHFLNPAKSDPRSVAGWARHVLDNPVAIYGDPAQGDAHVHGFTVGERAPEPYLLAFRGAEALFAGDGVSATGAPPVRAFRDRLIAVCNAQLAFFEDGRHKETDDPHYLRVGEYWRAVDSTNDGRTVVREVDPATGAVSEYRPAWSAAFVSWCMAQAGAGAGFLPSPGHCHSFQACVDPRPNALYVSTAADTEPVKPGDVVHAGRASSKRFTFTRARAAWVDDGFYSSHSDIVVAVDRENGVARVIGGNLSNSVRLLERKIDANGLLVDRVEDGQAYPWIGVMRLQT